MSEADEQRAVVEWCAWRRIPVFRIPNGGSRHKAARAFLRLGEAGREVRELHAPSVQSLRARLA